MFELNYSKINAYLFCNFLYKFIYIDGNYTKHNRKTSFGLSIHKALKEFGTRRLGIDRLLNSYEENWCNYGYSNGQEMMDYYYKGVDILKKFYEYEIKKKSTILYCEDYFDIDIGEDFVLRGTVDRIDKNEDGSFKVIDYKLGLEENGESVIKNNLQLSIYAFGVSKKYLVTVKNLEYYFVSNLKEVEAEYMGEANLLCFIKDCGKKMREAVFEKKGNCSICLAKDMCQFSDFKSYKI